MRNDEHRFPACLIQVGTCAVNKKFCNDSGQVGALAVWTVRT